MDNEQIGNGKLLSEALRIQPNLKTTCFGWVCLCVTSISWIKRYSNYNKPMKKYCLLFEILGKLFMDHLSLQHLYFLQPAEYPTAKIFIYEKTSCLLCLLLMFFFPFLCFTPCIYTILCCFWNDLIPFKIVNSLPVTIWEIIKLSPDRKEKKRYFQQEMTFSVEQLRKEGLALKTIHWPEE